MELTQTKKPEQIVQAFLFAVVCSYSITAILVTDEIFLSANSIRTW
jgi:hypothetical protein